MGPYLNIKECSELTDEMQAFVDLSEDINNKLQVYSANVWSYVQLGMDIDSHKEDLENLRSQSAFVGNPMAPVLANIVSNSFQKVQLTLLAQLWDYYLAGRYETLDSHFKFGNVSRFACTHHGQTRSKRTSLLSNTHVLF